MEYNWLLEHKKNYVGSTIMKPIHSYSGICVMFRSLLSSILFAFLNYINPTVWKRKNGWRMEEEEVGLWYVECEE